MSMASGRLTVAGRAAIEIARDHDLVDAALAELDDRVDHLLLLGLEDALLAATLDEQLELLGRDLASGRCRRHRARG